MVAQVGDYILIIDVGWKSVVGMDSGSWKMGGGGGDRETLRELERERLVTSFTFLLLPKWLILW